MRVSMTVIQRAKGVWLWIHLIKKGRERQGKGTGREPGYTAFFWGGLWGFRQALPTKLQRGLMYSPGIRRDEGGDAQAMQTEFWCAAAAFGVCDCIMIRHRPPRRCARLEAPSSTCCSRVRGGAQTCVCTLPTLAFTSARPWCLFRRGRKATTACASRLRHGRRNAGVQDQPTSANEDSKMAGGLARRSPGS